MVFSLQLFVVVVIVVAIRQSEGDTVHLMSVTSTPYGASQTTTSQFSCLLSNQDAGVISSVQTGRHVPRGSGDISLTLPAGFSSTTNTVDNYVETTLPGGNNYPAQGVYYCEASNRGLTTRVPVTILAETRFIQPANGHFTVTANVGSPTSLMVAPLTFVHVETIQWEKQPTSSDDAFTLLSTGATLSFNSVSVSDAGVYATYLSVFRNQFWFSLIRLIVRECLANRWGPPSCSGICDNCYNGGICDDKTGECVCRPGFIGSNCLTACSTNTFGWTCDHQCGVAVESSNCAGSVFCMPDPVGCSCMRGFTGQTCQNSCSANSYGANCEQTCHCATELTCDIFTGACPSGACATGYSGTNCQIPDVCPDAYYGSSCTDICPCKCDKITGSCAGVSECLRGFYGANCETECHCMNGLACDRVTGKCDSDPTTQLSLCEPGYISSSGINFDNCQQFEGCYDGCTETCHCSGGTGDCYKRVGTCLSNACKPNWVGATCQTGIVDTSFVKVNPNQPVTATCTTVGDPSAHVQMRYLSSPNTQQLATPTSTPETRGSYSITSFSATLRSALPVFTCAITMDGLSFATADINVEYYVLPQLTRSPRASNIMTTSVLIEWDAWDPNAGDKGDGPVIVYNVYNALQLVETAAVPAQPKTVYSVSIEGLIPGTTYNYYVTAERDGAGGEGLPSQDFVTFTTLTIPTQPPIIDPTTKTTSAIVTDQKETMAMETKPHLVEETSPADSITTVSSRDTDMRDRTTTVSNSGLVIVSGIEIFAGPESGSVIIEWGISENSEVSFYYIRYWKANENDIFFTQIEANDGISMYTFRGLDTNSRYHFQVQAETTAIKGSWSEIYVFKVPSGDVSDSTQPLGTNTVIISSIAAVVVVIVLVVAFLIYRLRISNSNNMQSRTENVQDSPTGIPMSHHDTRIRTEDEYHFDYEVHETGDNASGFYEDPDKLNTSGRKTHDYQSRINHEKPRGYHNTAMSRDNSEYQSAINDNKPRGYQNAAMFSDRGQIPDDLEVDYDIPEPGGGGCNDERKYQELDKTNMEKGHEYQALSQK